MILFQHVNNLCFGSSKENWIRLSWKGEMLTWQLPVKRSPISIYKISNGQFSFWVKTFANTDCLQKKVPPIFLLFWEVTFKLTSWSPSLLWCFGGDAENWEFANLEWGRNSFHVWSGVCTFGKLEEFRLNYILRFEILVFDMKSIIFMPLQMTIILMVYRYVLNKKKERNDIL